MSVWQSQLVKRFRNNVIIKDDTTAIVKRFSPNELLFDRITKGKDDYSVETMNPKGERKNSMSLISINNYVGC